MCFLNFQKRSEHNSVGFVEFLLQRTTNNMKLIDRKTKISFVIQYIIVINHALFFSLNNNVLSFIAPSALK
jgi:hypothetical protein